MAIASSTTEVLPATEPAPAQADEILSIVTRKPMQLLQQEQHGAQGDELFITYGAKPNEELLLAYGFALPDNGDVDFYHVQLAFGVDSGGKYPHRRMSYRSALELMLCCAPFRLEK